jgi:hypothetical protein
MSYVHEEGARAHHEISPIPFLCSVSLFTNRCIDAIEIECRVHSRQVLWRGVVFLFQGVSSCVMLELGKCCVFHELN